jgi:hypothetical protein
MTILLDRQLLERRNGAVMMRTDNRLLNGVVRIITNARHRTSFHFFPAPLYPGHVSRVTLDCQPFDKPAGNARIKRRRPPRPEPHLVRTCRPYLPATARLRSVDRFASLGKQAGWEANLQLGCHMAIHCDCRIERVQVESTFLHGHDLSCLSSDR